MDVHTVKLLTDRRRNANACSNQRDPREDSRAHAQSSPALTRKQEEQTEFAARADQTDALQPKKEPRSRGAQAFDGTELPSVICCQRSHAARSPAAGWTLVALRGRLLRTALAAGRGLARALLLLRRRMLLGCAALTATLAAGRGLFGALVLLRMRLVLRCTTLAGRGRLAGALSTTLRTARVRHSERRDGAAV